MSHPSNQWLCRSPAAQTAAADCVTAPAVAGQGGGSAQSSVGSSRSVGDGVAEIAVIGAGAKSCRTFSMSGMLAYRITRYPAFRNIASRSPSLDFLLRCDASSSSMTASTWKALSQITKSAVLRSNVFRVAVVFAFSKALKLTCANTIKSGTLCVSRLCMACSRSVSTGLFVGRSPVPVLGDESPFFFAISAANTTTAINTASTTNSRFTSFPPVESRNRNEWLSVADFLVRQNLRSALAKRIAASAAADQRSAAAAGAASAPQALPVGNHGEISDYVKGRGV